MLRLAGISVTPDDARARNACQSQTATPSMAARF
jgi:hypothetical protein